MSIPECTLRRATVDDLEGLKVLWERANLQVLDLERRLTEFQIAVTESGELLGALGLQIDSKQGKIHSEALTTPEHQDTIREQLWQRILVVARNHGLVRLWTEESSPFWTQQGFHEIDADDVQKKLPARFGDSTKHWHVLQLREESATTLSLEREFELFQAAQKESSDRMMEQAKRFKAVAYSILTVAVLVAGYFVLRLFIRNPAIFSPHR